LPVEHLKCRISSDSRLSRRQAGTITFSSQKKADLGNEFQL
jgi:hypothetical protein